MNFFGLGGRRRTRLRWHGWEDFGPPPPGPPTGDAADGDDDDADDEGDDDREYMKYRGWGGGGAPGMGGLELYRRSFSRRIETGPETRLRIENRNGRINVRTHDEPVIVIDVEAEVYAANSQEADNEVQRIERGITVDGNRVAVQVPELIRPEWFFFGRGPKVDYEVRVPVGTDVWAVNRNGPVAIAGIRGKARVESRNGRVGLENIGADVEVETRNGKLGIDGVGGSVKVSGRNGSITIERAAGAVGVETKNGPVEVREAGAGVKVQSKNGSIRLNGKVNGDYNLEAANGSIRVAVTPDSRFEIDAESTRGSTRSDLPVRDRRAAEGDGPAPKVRIRTVNGSIHLTEA
jgi:hypothetical protein